MLQAFCIDRPSAPGRLVCGYVRERQQARTEYRARVYAGSREDPALLEWEAPGRYKAHLYPLKAGASRRVVILYTEWLERQDAVRRWRYHMGMPGGAGPRIQEFRLEVDLTDAGARRVEAGLGAAMQGNGVVLQRSGLQPQGGWR
jgi:Ca-activated chloride channel family protein